ncbi:hypothetical protein [Spirosoma litoris]
MENAQATVKKTKRPYKTPQLKAIGTVQQLTLKNGSNIDGFGGQF